MLLNLNQIGQIALPVRDTDRAEAFYASVIGLRKLYRFGDLGCRDGRDPIGIRVRHEFESGQHDAMLD
jgi:catechol 2,3-dioxygenase-like lactoylglutathione lyase family enzyme